MLAPNEVPRFYRGGRAIARLRGVEPAGERVPEDWVGSTTAVFGRPGVGLSRLPGGALLRDAAAADPVAFFGPDHAARHGGDPALLVKLLDAGERLPVHVHPDRRFARMHLDSPVRQDRGVGRRRRRRAGRRRARSASARTSAPATLARWVADAGPRRAARRRSTSCPCAPGDALFVPAGVPHAIGEGVLHRRAAGAQRPLGPARVGRLRDRRRGRGDARAGLGRRPGLRRHDGARDSEPLRGARRRPRRGGGAAAAARRRPLLPRRADRARAAGRGSSAASRSSS